jgi:hypothetical protein
LTGKGGATAVVFSTVKRALRSPAAKSCWKIPVGDALAFRIARLRSDVGDLVGQHLSLGVAYGELLQQRPRQAPRHLGPRDGDRLSRPRRLQIVPHGDEHALGGAGGQRGQGQSGSGEHALHQ